MRCRQLLRITRTSLSVLGSGALLAATGSLLCDEPTSSPATLPPMSSAAAAVEADAVRIVHPFNATVFPADLAPPTFSWVETQAACDTWQLTFEFGDGLPPLQAQATSTTWSPNLAVWETLKSRSKANPSRMVLRGFHSANPETTLRRAALEFTTSPDPVGAPIFYRDVNLPFLEAVKDPSDIRWRLGSVADPEPPRVVLDRMPVCGNCHSFSTDGQILGMDVDYANSKGSYVITRTAREMALLPKDVITWDSFRREDGELTFGLLSQVSPDGRWVVSTVKDKSVFVPQPDLAFSQLFFPIKGILATYDRERRVFASLPGADDPEFVQSNPAWSSDGRWVVFARTKAYSLSNTVGQGRVLLTPEECREFTRDGRPFRYDLYRLPFNEGRGGTAEPLKGASHDGLSNYFPKYSPDGRWIVFCKSRNYMLLQPDSELYIIPAHGGTARRLDANLSRMNSWHSWSPNGRWLVFSSKALSDYTQLFLTHVDDQGNTTPPVLLDRFTATNRAANIPEFVNLPPGGIARIQSQFLNDYSFERAGNELYRGGEPVRAIEKYREALALNPANANAHQRLGFLLYHVQHQFEDGLAHTTEALRLDPRHALAHCDMGAHLLQRNRPDQAIVHLSAALETLPPGPEPQYQPAAVRSLLGKACLQLNRFPDAATHFQESIRLEPGQPEPHYLLALALVCQGNVTDAVNHLNQATALRPAIDTSVVLHELLAENQARAGRLDEAIRSAQRALELAQAAGKDDLANRVRARLQRYQAGSSARP